MAETQLFEKYGRTVKPGELIFSEGDDGSLMFIIQGGTVSITKTISGRKVELSALGKGDFFGEMALVTRVKRTATATAVDDVQLLAFDRNGFQGMIEKNSKIALNVIDKLCRRLQNSNAQIDKLVNANFKSVIALNFYVKFIEAGESTALSRDKSCSEIAGNVGVDSAIVEGVIQTLQDDGVLAITGNAIRLINRDALRKTADPTA